METSIFYRVISGNIGYILGLYPLWKPLSQKSFCSSAARETLSALWCIITIISPRTAFTGRWRNMLAIAVFDVHGIIPIPPPPKRNFFAEIATIL